MKDGLFADLEPTKRNDMQIVDDDLVSVVYLKIPTIYRKGRIVNNILKEAHPDMLEGLRTLARLSSQGYKVVASTPYKNATDSGFEFVILRID